MSAAHFDSCDLARADWTAARLEDVAFTSCDLSDANFERVACTQVDLRGARLDGVSGAGSLRGAVIAPDQLIGLAAGLADAVGITLVDRDDPAVRSAP